MSEKDIYKIFPDYQRVAGDASRIALSFGNINNNLSTPDSVHEKDQESENVKEKEVKGTGTNVQVILRERSNVVSSGNHASRHLEGYEESTSTPHAKRARIDDSDDTKDISSTTEEAVEEQRDDAADELTINQLLQNQEVESHEQETKPYENSDKATEAKEDDGNKVEETLNAATSSISAISPATSYESTYEKGMKLNMMYYNVLCDLYVNCFLTPPPYNFYLKPRLFCRNFKTYGFEKLDEYLDKNHPMWSEDRNFCLQLVRKYYGNSIPSIPLLPMFNREMASYIRRKWNTGLHIDLCQNFTAIPRKPYVERGQDRIVKPPVEKLIEIPEGYPSMGSLLEDMSSSLASTKDSIMQQEKLKCDQYFIAKRCRDMKESLGHPVSAAEPAACTFCPDYCVCGLQITARQRMEKSETTPRNVKMQGTAGSTSQDNSLGIVTSDEEDHPASDSSTRKYARAMRRLQGSRAAKETNVTVKEDSNTTKDEKDPGSASFADSSNNSSVGFAHRGHKRKRTQTETSTTSNAFKDKKILNKDEIIQTIFSQNKHMTASEVALMAKEAEDILNFNWCYNKGYTLSKQMVQELASLDLVAKGFQYYYPSPYVEKKAKEGEEENTSDLFLEVIEDL
eukprot:TRINITY_DN10024_c0_g1_i2.p1 TRINITY_DN10024_c0_g1~~TRINITY_DN10024_c0_g1_i2.p1  ORF type:complete len:625 (-),score=116.69 TRINITY_DN10024_c0_g1_i2:272-2146(-)